MNQSNFQYSQDFEVVPTRPEKVYTIKCTDWNRIKDKMSKIGSPWLYPAAGSVMLGSAITTLITIVLGTFDVATMHHTRMIAWCIFFTTGSIGLMCLHIANQEYTIALEKARDIVKQMNEIEESFDCEANKSLMERSNIGIKIDDGSDGLTANEIKKRRVQEQNQLPQK